MTKNQLWEVSHVSELTCMVRTIDYPQRIICILNDTVVGHRNPENAKLIAMAPSMVLTLRRIRAELEHTSPDKLHDQLKVVRVLADLILENLK